MIKECINKVVEGVNLSQSEMIEAMTQIMSGEATNAQIASLITALRMKGETVDENRSLYYGIRFLATKGFKGGVTYDKKTGTSTYTFQGWENATKYYNWPGVKKYQEYIKTMIDNSKTPALTDY